MFNIDGNFANGVITDSKVNGYKVMLAERERKVENFIIEFESAVAAGYSPNNVDLQNIIEKNNNIRLSDLTAFERERMKRRIERAKNKRNCS